MFASAGLSGAIITESDVQTFGKSSFTLGLINDPAFAFNGGAPTSGPTITINGEVHSTYSYGIPGANSLAAQGRWSGSAFNDFAPPQPPQPPDPAEGPTEF
jgi:hypothetical protein